MNPDYQKLVQTHKTIHYYNVPVLSSVENGILVCGSMNLPIMENAIKNNTTLIILLDEIKDANELKFLQMNNNNIVIICNHLKQYQKLLPYKSDDTLFLNHKNFKIPMKVILLMRDDKRVQHIQSNLITKLKDLTVFPAVDAMTPNAIENFIKENQLPVVTPIRAGKIGCTFSHISLWRGLFNTLFPSILILEDDIQPIDSYQEEICSILEEAPVTFDIIFLYVSPKFFRNDTDIQLANKNHLNKAYYTEDISAYIISRKGAHKLLQKFKVIDQPLDMMIAREIQRDNLEAYATRNIIFTNIGQKTATQENLLESNTYDSAIYTPDEDVSSTSSEEEFHSI